MKAQDIFDNECRDVWIPLIEQWVHSERDRAMLIRKHLDGLTYEKVAEEFDFSVNHCQAIIKKARNQLFKHIKIV